MILATFFNENSYNLEKALIDLVTLENGTASTIFEAMVSSLKDKGNLGNDNPVFQLFYSQ